MERSENCKDELTKAYPLNKWQRCLFRLKSPTSQPRDRADAVRGILSQIHFTSVTEHLPDDITDQLLSHYTGIYSSLVDCSNLETGMNNYAEGALALSSNCPNESSHWTSSLTKDRVNNLTCVKDLIAQSKKAHEEYKERLRSNADSLLRATQQRPPSNVSSWQQKSVQGTSAAPPQIHSTNLSAASTSSCHQPPPQPQLPFGRQNNCNSICMTGDPPSTGSKPTFQFIRAPNQPSVNFQGPSRPNKGPSLYRTVAAAGPQRAFNPGGVNRGMPSAGSTGYDPASQLCSLGILGVGDRSVNEQPSLKRKFGTTDSERPPGVFSSRHHLQAACSAGPSRTSYRVPRTQARESDENEDGGGGGRGGGAFRSAREQLSINQKKFGHQGGGSSGPSSYGSNRKVLGVTRRGPNSKFVPPVISKEDGDGHMSGYKPPVRNGNGGQGGMGSNRPQEPVDERLQNIEPKMVELIMSEIMDHGPPINWDDIAGLEFAKKTIKEIVVWPMLRPDIFTGLRGPPRGLLLFGPPGTGKTLIGKCIACQSGATFFSISASSLTSKWVGEGEKMVRALFAVARCYQPAVIFIDEIDSLLSQRSNDEHESSRRIKTEFLVQLDGATTSSDERLLVVGATNRPQEIDEAARRRLVKRLYIPLPDPCARKQIICNLLSQQSHSLSTEQLEDVCRHTEGYSGADMANLCREAALGPIRSIQGMDIQHISAEQVRPILHQDLIDALQNVRPSVAQSDLDIYLDWNSKFGCGSIK